MLHWSQKGVFIPNRRIIDNKKAALSKKGKYIMFFRLKSLTVWSFIEDTDNYNKAVVGLLKILFITITLLFIKNKFW